MVEDRITDGKRIAQLLASELDGRQDDELARVAVTNADRDVEPSADGARAYDVTLTLERDGDPEDESGNGSDREDGADQPDDRLARVFVHPEYAYLEFDRGREGALEAAADAGPDVRVEGSESTSDLGPDPVTVLVQSGAAVKRATTVVRAACRSAAGGGRE